MFSLLLKGGHPKVKLLWAAGGPTLSSLVSSETEEIGDDGQRELKSVCALERSTSLPSQMKTQPEKHKNGRAISICHSSIVYIYIYIFFCTCIFGDTK